MMVLPFRFVYSKVYQSIAKWIFIVTNSLGLLVNCADTVYYQFTIKRTTSLVFSQFSHEENMLSLWGQFIVQWWYISLIFVLLVALLVFLYTRFTLKKPTTKKGLFYTTSVAMFCVVAFLSEECEAVSVIVHGLFRLPTPVNT
jgi:phosphoglycerol transferase MdoB-like AlkP superfamily enzyme